MSPYVYLVQLAVPREHDAAFNRLYDEGYVPELLKIPGVTACQRFRLDWADTPDMPEYLALYDIADPELPRGEAWKRASVTCGWAERIRPHLTVRRHGMYRRLDGGLVPEPGLP